MKKKIMIGKFLMEKKTIFQYAQPNGRCHGKNIWAQL